MREPPWDPLPRGDGAEKPRRFVAPLVGLLVLVITGMSFSFFWNRLIHSSGIWVTPRDLWSTFRAAQYVTWGGLAQIYNNPAPFQTFPGIAIILAPVAQLADSLHLSASFPTALAHPTAWWVLGPVNLALGGLALFPLDELARRLGIVAKRRVALLALETLLIWPSVAIWGHPEDALSLALALWGLLALGERSWFRVGAFFGLAIVVQPLVFLIVPIVVALVPVRRWPSLVVEIMVPSLLALTAPLIQEWGPTTRTLLRQPNFLSLNHATPWASLAPVITPARVVRVPTLQRVKLPNGHFHLVEGFVTVHSLAVVAAGPGRVIAILAACAIGLVVKVRAPSWPIIVWLAALALSLRCVFEPVMVPYYLVPGLALALLVAARRVAPAFWSAALAAALCSWLSYFRVSAWDYYVAMTVPLAAVLATSWPSESRRDDDSTPISRRSTPTRTSG